MINVSSLKEKMNVTSAVTRKFKLSINVLNTVVSIAIKQRLAYYPCEQTTSVDIQNKHNKKYLIQGNYFEKSSWIPMTCD